MIRYFKKIWGWLLFLLRIRRTPHLSNKYLKQQAISYQRQSLGLLLNLQEHINNLDKKYTDCDKIKGKLVDGIIVFEME